MAEKHRIMVFSKDYVECSCGKRIIARAGLRNDDDRADYMLDKFEEHKTR